MVLILNKEGKLVQQSQTIHVAGIPYLIKTVHQGESYPLHHIPGLFTVINLPRGESVITSEWIEQCIDAYESSDDVFQNAFLQRVIFMETLIGCSLSQDAEAYLRGRGMQWYHFELVTRLKSLPSGE
ncbi:MAG: hypothetical protein Q9167_002415 [Letrouitia subvulpina]